MNKSFALAEVKTAQTDDPNGAFEAILSAPTLDRDGEIIDAKAFEPLPEHITIDMDHGLSMATTVGSGRPFYDGDVLKVSGTFSSIPRAQEARALVAEGHIRTMSVAFTRSDATKASNGEPPHIKRGELLNAAFVAVPSNRDALVLSAKAMDVKARPTTKAVAGSYEDRQEDIREALAEFADSDIAAAYPDSPPGERGWMVRVIATFDDHVVYQIGWDDDDALSVTYTWDGEEVTITGTAEPVTVDQVVTPATPDPENAPAKAAPSPASKAADAPTEAAGEQEAMRARALVLVASATAAAV